MSTYQQVNLEKIKIRKNANPRSNIETDEFRNFKKSIKAKGVLIPILIRPKDNGYELVAGERRLRASRQLKNKTIPAIVKPMTDDEAFDVMMIENIVSRASVALSEPVIMMAAIRATSMPMTDNVNISVP